MRKWRKKRGWAEKEGSGCGLMKREKGSKRGGSVQMRKWQEMRRLAEKVRSGRGLMKRETGSKGRKCANEKMAEKEGMGGKRRENECVWRDKALRGVEPLFNVGSFFVRGRKAGQS